MHPGQRYLLQGWLNFIATEIHKNIGPFFNPNAGEAWLQGVTANLQRRLPVIEAELGKHEYLNGEYSIADIYLFTVLGWAPVWPDYRAGLRALNAVTSPIPASTAPATASVDQR